MSIDYKVWVKKRHVQNLAIRKKSTIFVQSWWNLVKMINSRGIIFTKFHEDWTKIVDFLLMAKFWACLVFSLLRPYTKGYKLLIKCSPIRWNRYTLRKFRWHVFVNQNALFLSYTCIWLGMNFLKCRLQFVKIL